MHCVRVDCALGLFCLLAALHAGCGDENPVLAPFSDYGGHEDGSLLVAFTDSGCKQDAALRLQTDFTEGLSSSDLRGLQCVAWRTSAAEGLTVELLNFPHACGAAWHGEATFLGETSTLSLVLDNPSCTVAKCGSCLYDWSFELAGVYSDDDIDLAVATDPCPDDDTPAAVNTFVLHVAQKSIGFRCRHLPARVLGWFPTSGLSHDLCPSDGSSWCLPNDEQCSPCQEDLVCAPQVGAEHPVCMVPCDDAQDCPLLDLLTCDAGLCRLANPW